GRAFERSCGAIESPGVCSANNTRAGRSVKRNERTVIWRSARMIISLCSARESDGSRAISHPRSEECMRSIGALLAVAMLPVQVSFAQTAVKWGPAPAIFPAGAKMAVMQGDPSKHDLFTVRLDMPSGYRIAPHYHPTDEHITVLSGNFLVGMGDKLDAKNTMSLKAG